MIESDVPEVKEEGQIYVYQEKGKNTRDKRAYSQNDENAFIVYEK